VPSAPDEGLIGIGFTLKYHRSVDFIDVLPRHYSIVLVLRGTGMYRDEDGREWPLSPGWTFQRVPWRRHSNFIDPHSRWSEVYLAFGPSLCRELVALGAIVPEPLVAYTGFDSTLIARFLAARDQLADAPEHELTKCLATSIDLLGELRSLQSAPADPVGALMARACRELASDLDRRLDLDALARRLGFGYERFRKLFRERVGTPPGEYRIRRRLERARELLGLRQQGIAAIAAELGYQNPFAFSIQFKRYTGVSPSGYQRLR
jgi:AraC-like DNA-binding protein